MGRLTENVYNISNSYGSIPWIYMTPYQTVPYRFDRLDDH